MAEAIYTLLKTLIELLIPKLDADPQIQFWWRVRVALLVCFTFSASIVGPVFAFSSFGFARASELIALRTERRRDRAEEIDQGLLELRRQHCAADTAIQKQLYWDRIHPLMDHYHELTGRDYPLPDCRELGL